MTVDTMLNRESGLKALAGNNDMRSIVEAAEAGDERAQWPWPSPPTGWPSTSAATTWPSAARRRWCSRPASAKTPPQFRVPGGRTRLGALGVKLDAGANRSPEQGAPGDQRR